MTDLTKLTLEPKSRPDSCATHGVFEAKCYFGSVWSRCPTCAAQQAELERQAEREAAQQARLAAWQKRIGQSGIPERFQDRRLDDFLAATEGQLRALKFAKAYADNFERVLATGRSALFIGKPGTGKTHLAAGIAVQIMQRQSRTVLFSTVMRAIRRIKDTWARGAAESETQAIATLVAPDLLILDEVGVQFGSEFERNILFDVLNERYEKRRPTILISNLPVGEVGAYLGERIVDRIREDGGARIIFDWQSHRTLTPRTPS
jgi:DNA replication protein DnaC